MKSATFLVIAILVVACSGAGPTAVPTQAPQSPNGGSARPIETSTSAATAAATTPATAAPATATAAATETPAATTAATEPPATAAPTEVPPTTAATESPAPATDVVELVAGGGALAAANGVAATDAILQRPSGVAAAPDGTIWITDVNLNMLLHITADGTLADIVSNLNGPEGVSVGPDGTVYVADRSGYRIVSTTGGGTVDRVAGELFNAGFRGDGGPARRALLFLPFDVATSANGDLYIADSANQRIRLIGGGTGDINTIVGTGVAGFAGDGGQTLEAQISSPQAIAVDADGTRLLIADTANVRLRQVDLSTGAITTVAGTGGNAVSFTDTLSGIQTPITRIAALAMDLSGNAYFVVFWGDLGNVIMRLTPDGKMTRVVGGGRSSTPGVAPNDFGLPDVLGLAIDPFTAALLICGSDGKVYRLADVATDGPDGPG